jgi:hypothetical protein
MKTVVFSLLLLAILTVPDTNLVRASDAPLSSIRGRVLILKNNEYTMEGDIERIAARYRVRRKLGETWVPAERVLALLPSLPDAYTYLRKRINLEDADERLKLARWCRANNLPEQAMAELQAAAILRPDHAETRRLLQHWKQTVTATPKPASPKKPTAAPDKDLPPVEVTMESLGLFVTRVQPILMNTCAHCHATGHGGNFHLGQVYGDGIGNRRTMERNLAEVLKQVNLNQPDASRLLIKAISDHARSGQAPIRDRQTPPYRTLEHWVQLTVASNPHLREHAPSPIPVSASPSVPLTAERPAKSSEETEWGADAKSTAAKSVVPAPAPSNAAASPSVVPFPTLTDPYDPEIFNRKMHPEANKPEPPK